MTCARISVASILAMLCLILSFTPAWSDDCRNINSGKFDFELTDHANYGVDPKRDGTTGQKFPILDAGRTIGYTVELTNHGRLGAHGSGAASIAFNGDKPIYKNFGFDSGSISGFYQVPTSGKQDFTGFALETTSRDATNYHVNAYFSFRCDIPELKVSEPDVLTATGHRGGPFSPDTFSYKLQNLNFRCCNDIGGDVSSDKPWLEPTQDFFFLLDGQEKTIEVKIDAAKAALLPAGDHTANITFRKQGNNGSQSNAHFVSQITLSIKEPVTLVFSPTTPVTRVIGSGDPLPPETITYSVENKSSIKQAFTLTKTQSWIDLPFESASMTGGANLNVPIIINEKAKDLPPGDYKDTITFTNVTTGIGSTTATISLSVKQPARLSVTPETSVNVTGPQGGPFTPNATTYTLKNTGGLALNFDTQVADWITLTPSSGTVAPGASTTVTASTNTQTNALPVGGPYSDQIRFNNTTNGRGNTLRVFNVTVLRPATLSLSPDDSLVSSGLVGGPFTPNSKAFTVKNVGDEVLNFTAASNQPWLDVSPKTGTVAPGASTTLTTNLTASANGLAAGHQQATLTVTNTDNGLGTTSRPVSLTVLAPGTLSAAPTTGLIASGPQGGEFTPGQQSYTLSNGGGVPITVTASGDQPWFDVTPATLTIAAGGTATVTATLNAAANGLPQAAHVGTLTLTNTTDGLGSTTRPVHLTVKAPAAITVTPSAGLISQGVQGGPFTPNSKTYTVHNTGGEPAIVTGSADQSWLDVSPTSTTLNPGTSVTVTASLNAAADALAAGNHQATLSLQNTTNGTGSTTRLAHLTVLTPAALSVVQNTPFAPIGQLGGPFTPTSTSFTLHNSGSQAMNYAVSGDKAWLGLSPAAGVIPGNSTVTVSAMLTPSALTEPVGESTATLTFTNATNGVGTTARTSRLTVLEPAILSVSTGAFSSTGHQLSTLSPASKLYTLSNPGQEPLDFTVSTATPWLTISPQSGNLAAGQSVSIYADLTATANTLSVGDHTGLITFTNTTNGAGSATRDANLKILPPLPGKITVAFVVDEGDATFAVSSNTPALTFDVTTKSGKGQSPVISVPEGAYTAQVAAPDGFGFAGGTCSGPGNAFNRQTATITLNVRPAEDINCTIIGLNARQHTSVLISKFMSRRAELLLSNDATNGRGVARLSGRGSGGQVSSGFLNQTNGSPLTLSAEASGGSRFAFSTSLLQVAHAANRANKRKLSLLGDKMALGHGVADSDQTEGTQPRFDVWVEGQLVSFTDSSLGRDDDGLFSMLSLGADYLASENVLLGAVVQFDYTRLRNDIDTSSVFGAGWMAGPYATIRLPNNVYVSGRAAWGQSSNKISPYGGYSDKFDTTRWLARGKVEGNWTHGPWRLNPGLSVAYIEEQQEAYVDGLSVLIPSQTVSVGQADFGPTVTYRFDALNNATLEPTVGVTGVWTFNRDGGALTNQELNGGEGLRAKIEFGLRARTDAGLSVSLQGAYDGIGDEDYEAINGRASISIPFH